MCQSIHDTAFNFRPGFNTSHNSLRFKNIIVSSVDQQISSLMSSGPPIALLCIIPQQFSSLCYMQIKIHRYGICCGPIYIYVVGCNIEAFRSKQYSSCLVICTALYNFALCGVNVGLFQATWLCKGTFDVERTLHFEPFRSFK